MNDQTNRIIDEAVSRFRAGDVNAFAVIVDQTVAVLRAYVGFFVRGRDRADDVLQESYMAILKNIAQYRQGTSFIAWAKAVARFQALASNRGEERREQARQNYVDSFMQMLSEASEKMDEASPLERKMGMLQDCLAKLSERVRETVSMHYFQNKSLAEIAQRQQATMSSVKMTLHRGRMALAECVERSK
jgi:RNA polymerase sigma-70 factor, ECF subfamily